MYDCSSRIAGVAVFCATLWFVQDKIVEDGFPAHGYVDAVTTAMRRLDFSRLICSRHSRQRDLPVAMVAARIPEPKSKLVTTLW